MPGSKGIFAMLQKVATKRHIKEETESGIWIANDDGYRPGKDKFEENKHMEVQWEWWFKGFRENTKSR